MSVDDWSGAGENIATGAEDFGSDTGSAFETAGSDIERDVDQVGDDFAQGDLFPLLVDIPETVIDPVMDLAIGGIEDIGDLGKSVEGLGEGVWDAAQDVGSGVADVAEDVGSGVADAAEDVGSAVESGASDVVDGVEDIGEDIADLF